MAEAEQRPVQTSIYDAETLIADRFRRPGETGVVSPNERRLLQLIWRNPGISRSEITSYTGLTQQSVHRILDQLSERSIILLGSAKPGMGREQPSPMLRLNGQHAYASGISVNTDVIGICLMDFAGNFLGEREVPLRETTMTEALQLVKQQVSDLRRQNDLTEENSSASALQSPATISMGHATTPLFPFKNGR